MGSQKVALCSKEHQLVWHGNPFGFSFFPQGDPGIQGYHGRKVSLIIGMHTGWGLVGNMCAHTCASHVSLVVYKVIQTLRKGQEQMGQCLGGLVAQPSLK